jgi:hypothetical protein
MAKGETQMKKLIICASLLVVLIGNVRAAIIFSDDFNINGLDASKWTALGDPGCYLEVTGGVLRNYFDGYYRSSYAKSVDISLPSNWTSVTVTGQWAFPVNISGELLMAIKDADASNNGCIVAYDTWNGLFRAQDSQSFPYNFLTTPRSYPQSLTNFEWTITPTGWQFKECRDGFWTTLVDRNNTLTQMNKMFLLIGGWEYTGYGYLQETNYDNIEVSVIPEPATICLLGLGALSLIRRRKNNIKK